MDASRYCREMNEDELRRMEKYAKAKEYLEECLGSFAGE